MLGAPVISPDPLPPLVILGNTLPVVGELLVEKGLIAQLSRSTIIAMP